MPGAIFKKMSKANNVGIVNSDIRRSVRKISTPTQELAVGVRDCSYNGLGHSSQGQVGLEKGLEGDQICSQESGPEEPDCAVPEEKQRDADGL